MRWNVLMWLLMTFSCVAQEKTDSIITEESQYQIGKPWNGLFVSAIQNPAFAGFDRNLQFQDLFSVENSEIRNQEFPNFLLYNTASWIEVGFGGVHQNIGLNIRYDSGRRFYTDVRKASVAFSYRIRIQQHHHLILGLGGKYLFLGNRGDYNTFPDMIDPRYGFVYPTSEYFPFSPTQHTFGFSFGLNYNWKNLLVSSALSYQRRGMVVTGNNDHQPFIRFDASYIIRANKEVSLMPFFGMEYDNFLIQFNPAIGLDWTNRAFVLVSMPELTMVGLTVGGQFWKIWRIHAAVSAPYNKYLYADNGLSFELGVRLQFGLKQIR